MFSVLRKNLIYTDVSRDVVEHDNDNDADSWLYDDRMVYRGTFDPRYTQYNLNVYSLYDDDLNRVGIAEHEVDEPEVYKALWFYDNPFATLLQNPEWKQQNKTLWATMCNEAYQDCLEDEFKHVSDWALGSNVCIITPEMLTRELATYECKGCRTKSFSNKNLCSSVKKNLDFTPYSFLFIDDSYILYTPPSDFRLPLVRHDASSLAQKTKPPVLAAQSELSDAAVQSETPQQAETQQEQSPPPLPQ
jgi:hypothetical protein